MISWSWNICSTWICTCRCTVNIPVCSNLFIRPIFLCKVITFGSKVYLQYMYTFTIALQKVRKFQKDTWHFLKEKLEQRGTLSCVTEMWPPPSTFKTTTLWTAQGAEIQVCTIILVHIIILYSTSNHSKFKMHTDDYSMKVIILFQMQHWEILLLCFQYSDNEHNIYFYTWNSLLNCYPKTFLYVKNECFW